MCIKLKNTSLICDRFAILNRATTAVVLKVSSVLKGVGIVTNDDHFHVVEKCKIKREKKAKCRELQNQNENNAILSKDFTSMGGRITHL